MATGSQFQRGLPWPDTVRQVHDLLADVAWFNRLRLVAGLAVILLTALVTHGLAIVADPWPLYCLGVLIAVVDGGYILYYPRLLRGTVAAVRGHVLLQIVVDLLILTALLHYTGGITNPLVLFYLFHAFVAALVLSVRVAIGVATLTLLLVTLLGAAERLGWLPHRSLGLGLMDLAAVKPLGLGLLLLAYALTLAFSIYCIATVLAQLRHHEQQLLRLGRQLASSEKQASVGTLAAGVSHEINNPVGVIANKVQVLRYRIQDGDDRHKLLAELDVIEKHARRIGQITAGLLTFSREAPFELRPVDVAGLVHEAVDLVRVPCRAAGVELVIRGSGSPRVLGSPNHLLQVLVNLLLNAKDASSPGSSVQIGWDTEGGETRITVADHGCGIPAENLAKVFDPFFTTKDVDKGTGLGLAISHGIVERHSGRIEVESEVGQGATFRVVLPPAPAAG